MKGAAQRQTGRNKRPGNGLTPASSRKRRVQAQKPSKNEAHPRLSYSMNHQPAKALRSSEPAADMIIVAAQDSRHPVGSAAFPAYIGHMFDTLPCRLSAPAPNCLPPPDARLALAALLVRVARAHGRYTTAKRLRIDRRLANRSALSPSEATALRHEAEALKAEAPDTVRFTRALKDAVAHEHRAGLMQALWAVALADGQRNDEEDQLLRLVSSLLGLTGHQSAIVRQRLEEERK